MDVRATFLPIGEELINNVFPTNIVYTRNLTPTYDPSTGDVTPATEIITCKAGVLSRGRTEDGGVGESYQLRLWIHHGTSGMPFLPTTADTIEYDSTVWKVTEIDPTYSSEGLIASRITARNQ